MATRRCARRGDDAPLVGVFGVPVTPLEEALLQAARFFQAEAIPHMLVGGLANAVWGEPRATVDVDFTVWVEEARLAVVVERLAGVFRPLPEDPLGFVQQTRVLPLESQHQVRVDVIFGLLPFEREALARSIRVDIAGFAVPVVSPEDLVLMKIISERSQDLGDARAVIQRQRGRLDLDYLRPRVQELSRLLDKPEIFERFCVWLQSGDPAGGACTAR